MIYKTPSPQPGHTRVVFELPSSVWADRISLVGEFNDWDHRNTPLTQGRDGAWRAQVDLPTGGQYKFGYLVNGQWQTDRQADDFGLNEQNKISGIVITS